MTYSFNLIDRPWIPCLTLEDERLDLSLHDTLAGAHRLREVFCDSPLETAALYRLLLAILYWTYRPDEKTWAELWRKRADGLDSERLANQWAQWRHRFDLFDPHHPFFQVADESQLGERAPVNKMIPQLTPQDTLFDHRLSDVKKGVKLSAAEAARALLTNQCYGIGYKQFVDAPCAKGVMFLIQGTTLLELLLLNLVRYPQEVVPYDSRPEDAPAWTHEDVFDVLVDGQRITRKPVPVIRRGKPDLDYPEQTPLGQLDYLTWHNRRTKLLPTGLPEAPEVREIAWAPGMRLKKHVLDPQMHYSKRESGWVAYRLTPERAIWRDLTAFLNLTADMEKAQPIVALRRLAERAQRFPELNSALYSLTAFGLVKDKGALRLMRQERTPLPAILLREEGIGALSRALRTADQMARVFRRTSFVVALLMLYPEEKLQRLLDDGMKTLDKRLGSGSSSSSKDQAAKRAYALHASWGIERVYWSRVEPCFYRFVQQLPASLDAALDSWRSDISRIAGEVFGVLQTYAGHDARAVRATAVGHQVFLMGRAQVLGSKRDDDSVQPGEDETQPTEESEDETDNEVDTLDEIGDE